ncbi:NUDIX hydrolase [Weissella kandleri]
MIESNDESAFKESVEQEQSIYRGHILDLNLETVRLPDGRKAKREIIHHQPAVAALVLNEQDQMLMVQQWRAAVRQMTLEIPAGKVDNRDQTPLEAMERELNEETRLQAGQLEQFTAFYSSIGFADEKIYLYLAQHLTPVQNEMAQDSDENLNLVWYDFATVQQMFEDGRLNDAKTNMAYLYWKNLRQREG